MKRNKVLVVEDSPALAQTFESYLVQDGYETMVAETGKEAFERIKSFNPDAIFLDLKLPDMNGMEILKKIREDKNDCAVIVITAEASVNTAVEAMRLGAQDFVAKPVGPERLRISLSNALEKRELEKIATTYQGIARSNFCDFIGGSMQMQAVYRILENAANSKAPVFITGESGTGKELAARAIHELSSRQKENFIPLNCAAIPRDLVESEIFGHKKGSFTGAVSDREGAAKESNKGTLFFDELAEMPIEQQSKLLRLIQTGTFTPVGASKPEEADIRFICATNREPMEAVKKEKLREDLYYRLNVIPVALPPLRERGEDIILLAEAFLEERSHEENKSFKTLADNTKDVLMNYDWPGNVRQLENVIRNAIVMNDGEVLTPEMLPRPLLDSDDAHHMSEAPEALERNLMPVPPSSLGILINKREKIRTLEEYEREIIEKAISACKGNVTEASKRLGINPSTVYRKQKTWEEAEESIDAL